VIVPPSPHKGCNYFTRFEADYIVRPGGAGLSEFLRSLERISSALSRLQATNLRSNQEAITDLTRLVRSGSQQLEAVFQDTLREDMRGIEPLFYITKRTSAAVLCCRE
jgi:exocyst complex protein 7